MTSSSPMNSFRVAVEGFIPSIIAIGLIRAWLSFQNGLGSLFETGLLPGDVLLRGILFTMFLGVFGVVRLESLVTRFRARLVLGAGIACALVYAIGFAFTQSVPVLVAESAFLCAGYAFFTRVWGEDNCSANFDIIVIRLALSFFVQYAAYSCLLVVPPLAQNVLTALLPMGIALFLHRASVQPEQGVMTRALLLPTFKVILLLGVVVLSCFCHGALFTLSPTLSGTWTLGPLIVAIASLLIVRWVKPRLLLRMMVCLTLLSQCVFAVPSLLSSFDTNWVSILKSFSYAGTMMLTLSFGCWLGKVRGKGGRSVCLWEFAYFVAFYIAQGLFSSLAIEPVVAIVTAFTCLLLAALSMMTTEWSLVPGKTESSKVELSEEDKVALLADVAQSKGLTPKEAEVLMYLFDGQTNGDIAQALMVSKNTVRTQVQSIYQKLDVHSRDDVRLFFDATMQERL